MFLIFDDTAQLVRPNGLVTGCPRRHFDDHDRGRLLLTLRLQCLFISRSTPGLLVTAAFWTRPVTFLPISWSRQRNVEQRLRCNRLSNVF